MKNNKLEETMWMWADEQDFRQITINKIHELEKKQQLLLEIISNMQPNNDKESLNRIMNSIMEFNGYTEDTIDDVKSK